MKNKIIMPVLNPKSIKVQLDHKTIITISHIEALKAWLQRFPGAKVIVA